MKKLLENLENQNNYDDLIISFVKDMERFNSPKLPFDKLAQ
ncbi:hypothetical protein [Okeania sp.]|nr:hypothetical protein [Okeania sp.]MEB3343002.1 hypothetical protein [Okeania sp.]